MLTRNFEKKKHKKKQEYLEKKAMLITRLYGFI